MVGDGRRYLTALIALDEAAVDHWAGTQGKGAVGIEALGHDPDMIAELHAAVRAVNERHARVENIRKWRIDPGALTIANGELTPTLTVKRNVVCDRYSEFIREMYADRSDEAQPTGTGTVRRHSASRIVSRE